MSERRRNAVVTGAASGLGRAIAVRLAQEGWRVVLADVNSSQCEETLQQVRAAGSEGVIECLDVTRPEAWQTLRDKLREESRQLDLLVNNAGVGGAGEIGEFSLDDWQWLLNVNLYGAIYGCHAMVGWMKENPRGAHIINTASFAAMGSAPSMAAYNVSKAGILSLSETLYVELKQHGIGVTVLCPFFFQTGLLDGGRFVSDAQRMIAADFMRSAGLTAASVADAAVRAMHRKQLYVVVGRQARCFWWIKRCMPVTFLNLVSRGYFRKLAKANQKAARNSAAPTPPAPPLARRS